MNFDGLFELAIDILVRIEYLNVKIEEKLWFLQFFFSAILLLFYYKLKWPNFEKKVLISEVANKTVLVFCMRPNRDTTYIPYLDHFSIL